MENETCTYENLLTHRSSTGPYLHKCKTRFMFKFVVNVVFCCAYTMSDDVNGCLLTLIRQRLMFISLYLGYVGLISAVSSETEIDAGVYC